MTHADAHTLIHAEVEDGDDEGAWRVREDVRYDIVTGDVVRYSLPWYYLTTSGSSTLQV